MAAESPHPTSFSASRRWSIFFSVVVSMVAVFALVIMANYLGARYFMTFTWSTQAKNQLFPQTVGLLNSFTNQVKVVIYYDKSAELYSEVKATLDEYRLINRHIIVETVDYEREAAAAEKIKDTYKLGSTEAKNLVIFDCDGRTKIIPDKQLGDYSADEVPNEKEREFKMTLKDFKGEMYFNAALLGVLNDKPLKAYFLEKHGEADINSEDPFGYSKFKSILMQNYVLPQSLQLQGTNPVPADCNLLIIAGPQKPLLDSELDKISQYLDQGGRLLVLFNELSRTAPTGPGTDSRQVGREREQLAASATRTHSVVGPTDNLLVSDFDNDHPLMRPLLGLQLHLILPRAIGKLASAKDTPGAPKVDELAFSADTAFLGDSTTRAGQHIPLMVAVEKGNAGGVFTERGQSRFLVTGDSFFLYNHMIKSGSNSDFAASLVSRIACCWTMHPTPARRRPAARGRA